MADMTQGYWCQKLREWAEREERENGLIDVKFFPRLPGDPEVSLEEAAKEAYEVLSGQRDSVDITDEEF